MKIRLVVAAGITAIALAFAATAQAHEDYDITIVGDHYGHWPGTVDNTQVIHQGTAPLWNGTSYGDPSLYGWSKVVPISIYYANNDGRCGTGARWATNIVAYVQDALAAEANRLEVYRDGYGCLGLYTTAAFQDLQAFFGLPRSAYFHNNSINLIDLIASNG